MPACCCYEHWHKPPSEENAGLEPYLNMEMRLGEGSGAALAMPIIEAACAIYNNMGELAASNIVLPGNTTSDLNS